jgi:hypothetical protein
MWECGSLVTVKDKTRRCSSGSERYLCVSWYCSLSPLPSDVVMLGYLVQLWFPGAPRYNSGSVATGARWQIFQLYFHEHFTMIIHYVSRFTISTTDSRRPVQGDHGNGSAYFNYTPCLSEFATVAEPQV